MLNATFKIADKSVGAGAAPYVVAEAGSNFNQSLDTARKLIDVAVEAGADCVKFQLFRADVLQPDKGTELYQIFKSVELNADWVPILAEHAKKQDIHFAASAFDTQSLAVLEAIGVPLHKVASSETTNLRFVYRVAAAGKPVLLSTGMCDMVDVEEAVAICEAAGNRNVALLQCGAMYPLPPELANLRVMQSFTRFGGPVGFSDHTLGLAAAAAAAGLGAVVYEKHFTLDKTAKGPDHSYALEPQEFKSYIAFIREAHAALGAAVKDMLPDERKGGRREGLYAARALAKGDTLTAADIVKRRPAVGLRDRYAGAVVGATLTAAVDKDQPLTWDVLTFAATP